MQVVGIVDIENIKKKGKTYIMLCSDKNGNSIYLHANSIKKIPNVGDRIKFEGYFNSNGSIETNQIQNAYIEKTSIKIYGKEKIVCHNNSNQTFNINLEAPEYSLRMRTFLVHAKAGTKEAYNRIVESLNKKIINYEGVMIQNSIYLSKID